MPSARTRAGTRPYTSQLGTPADFARLIDAAAALGIEIALDFAIQCSPDHPWIKQHPEWFDWRPDGSIKHAENPPKKYEDIVNMHFYGMAIPALWFALARHRPAVGRPRREDLPGRQSAHQAVRILGMAHRRSP